MAFVDLEKAFDRVPRKVIWWAMRKLGVDEWIVRLIQGMYSNARSRVRVGEGYSEEFEVTIGVHQGCDVPRSASYGVYISQLIRFARVSSHVDDFNTRNKVLTAKLLRQGYRYHKLRKAFSKFYRRHFDIVSKYNVGLKTLLLQGLSEPEFYGDLVYKFRKIIGKIDFPYHFKKIIVRYKKIGYNINVMRQTACLVVNPIKVNSFAYLFNCTTVGRTSD